MSESEGLAQIAQQMQELEQFANDLGLPPAPQLQDAEVSHEPENAHGDELVKFVLRSQRFDDRVCIARRLDILPPILRSSVKDVVRKAEFRFRGLKIPQRATADSLEASSDIPDVIQVVDIAAISVVVNSENGAYPPLTFVVAGGVPMQEIFQFYFTAYEVDRETVRFKLGRKTISPGDTTDTLKLMDKIRIRIMSVEEAEKEDEQDNITETVETPEPVNSKKRRRVRKPPSIRARTAIGSSSLPLKPRSQPPVPEEQEICLYLQKKSFPRRMYFVHPTAKLQHCMEMYEQGIGGERLVFYVHVGGKLRHIDRNQTPKEWHLEDGEEVYVYDAEDMRAIERRSASRAGSVAPSEIPASRAGSVAYSRMPPPRAVSVESFRLPPSRAASAPRDLERTMRLGREGRH